MRSASIFEDRRCGVLLHVTSLPSANLGNDAYRFVDFLHEAGVTLWQMLPLGPTHSDGSPYQCLSAHAGNIDFLSVQKIREQSWADPEELSAGKIPSIIALACRQFHLNATATQKQAFDSFCQAQSYWLEDYILYREIRHLNHSTAWFDWPDPLRDRDPAALAQLREQRADSLRIRRFGQFLFYCQWQALKNYANERGVSLFGDMPIFVAHDSADVWAEPALFTLTASGDAEAVAGVPPDYFSETGQRWGNPLYRWQQHIDTGFDWWRRRLKTQLGWFDLIRIDHFRGFEACWEIPAECETAIEGQWVKSPGESLFKSLVTEFGELPLVAEDLGIITDDVNRLREKFAMPGMKILQFAFGGDASNPYLPHNHTPDSVTYTGTHDNDTTLGWYQTLDDGARSHLHTYAGHTNESMPWLLVRMALQSVSRLTVLPMQDVLALDGNHRMNTPGTIEGNWSWRFNWKQVSPEAAATLRHLIDLYGRNPILKSLT
ncbi:4-alpha-glucanotransferase (amylomaltase) [Methylophaga frappieri]|uniref:4-alpha-glucanotransferase n=1 Tax=Methylophaga frappieri (strain ATCC BAA-2434 / DSM 25690 / JAM7) TaxID=754477 RepID=I1YGX0_METFJ|nr:4-alpha-glucanotransferase [Methylophaga frappieri]AFJ02163.1 4-alpha-glucanotransferase (amylomaltase) [Methylophaga frappieri]